MKMNEETYAQSKNMHEIDRIQALTMKKNTVGGCGNESIRKMYRKRGTIVFVPCSADGNNTIRIKRK